MKLRICSLAVVALVTAVVPIEAQTTLNANSHAGPRASQRSPSGYPTTWYVDVNAAPPGTGRQASPYSSIQYAIAQPTTLDGDSVIVLPGTYLEHLDFLGKDIRVVSAGGPAVTIVDGQGSGSVASFLAGEGPDALLDGFTLRGGVGSGTMPEIRGGGLLCVGASPTLRDLVVRENEAKRGAGMFFQSSSARVEACVIESNTPPNVYQSDNYGGGVYVACDAAVVFDHCTIRDNHNSSGGALEGGGVYGGGTYLDCVIEANIAYRASGVHGGFTCDPALFDCVIRGNHNDSPEWTANNAGGVLGPATLTRCTIEDNSAWFFGGGAHNATLVSCTVRRNTAHKNPQGSLSGNGGGTYGCTLVDCDVYENVAIGVAPTFVAGTGGGIAGGSATRCRIWGNTADRGGGAANASLERCTLYGNFAGLGGGFSLYFAPAVNVRNSIVYYNALPQVSIDGGTASFTYSDVQGGIAGAGNIDADPMFVSEAMEDFHLLLGSPCIDAGDPATLDPDGSRADMGAYPYVPGFARSLAQGGGVAVDAFGFARGMGTQGMFGAEDLYLTTSASRVMDSIRAQLQVLDRTITWPALLAIAREAERTKGR